MFIIMGSKSLVVVFLIFNACYAGRYFQHWARDHERSLSLQQIERDEALGNLEMRAGSWTESPLIYDTTTSRLTIRKRKHFFKYIPSCYTGYVKSGGQAGLVPFELNSAFIYSYNNVLSAYVDGYYLQRVRDFSSVDSSLFLNDRNAEHSLQPNQYEHIKGLPDFDIKHSIAYLELNTPVIQVGTGRRRLRWGNGFNGGLIVSGNAEPVNLFYHLHKKIGKGISLSAFMGFPDYNNQYYPDTVSNDTRYNDGERYIAGHRAEWLLADRFRITLNEVVNLNGQREFNRYFNPLQVYFLASLNSELASNLLASIELSCKIRKGLTVYAELLNDDITFVESGNPSRYAYQAGLSWFGLDKKETMDLRLEYTYVTAYTYTHFNGSKNWHIWAGECAGYWLGPDSDHFYLHGDKKLFQDQLRFRLAAHNVRRGEKNLYVYWDRETDGSGEDVPYIQGVVEKVTGLEISAEYKLTGKVSLFGLTGLQLNKNYLHSPGVSRKFPYFQGNIQISY